jgi:hypothetical protein
VSSASVNQTSRQTFPFGILALIFISISLFGTLFLKHPSNDPKVIQLADYLLIMCLASFVPIIPLALDHTPPDAIEYNIFALLISFLVGLGFVAIFRALAQPFTTFIPELNEFFDVFFVNEELATLSVFNLPTEITMFFVASIEELTFRVALPVLFMRFYSKKFPSGLMWLAVISASSVLFGMWHLFAYNADTILIGTAMIAGILLSVGYRLGAAAGGRDLAFLGVVIGHYFWNLTVSGLAMAIPVMVLALVFIVAFVLLLSPKTQRAFMTTIGKYKRGLFR